MHRSVVIISVVSEEFQARCQRSCGRMSLAPKALHRRRVEYLLLKDNQWLRRFIVDDTIGIKSK